MPDNNRYVGDVFIDGATQVLLENFLTELFNRYNGPGNGFDADMLDGHHYKDISDELERLDKEKLSSITIGGTTFDNTTVGAYLSFGDVIYNNYSGLPWITGELPEHYTITDALLGLHAYINNQDAKKVDKEKVDENDTSENPRMKVLSDNNFSDKFKNDLEDLSKLLEDFVDYIDENGDTHRLLNAGLINGLRLILITQEDYDNLETSFKTYWRNIFIIKDPAEMPTSIDYSSPLQYPLEEGYEFRLAKDDEPADNLQFEFDDNDERDIWLQIRHKWGGSWQNLIPLDDFFANTNINPFVKRVIEEDASLNYNEDAMRRVLEALLLDSSNENYIDLNFMSADYMDDFVYQLTKNNQTLASTKVNGFKSIDLSNLFQTEFQQVNSTINGITNTNGTGSLDKKIATVSNATSTLNTQINGSADNSITNQLTALGNSISGLSGQLSSLESAVTTLNTPQTYVTRVFTTPNDYLLDGKTYLHWSKIGDLCILNYWIVTQSPCSQSKEVDIADIPSDWIPVSNQYQDVIEFSNGSTHRIALITKDSKGRAVNKVRINSKKADKHVNTIGCMVYVKSANTYLADHQ